ncbi:MAG: hypothetical protein V4467_02290 [Patescibacteria group bacterium]
MNNNPEQKIYTIKETILNKIRTEELTMRPKGYFVAKVAVLVGISVAILLVSVLIFNFIFFTLRINGHDSLLLFGWRGLFLFVEIFPWSLLFLDVILILFLEWMVRKFRFGYRTPVVYLLIGIFSATIALGLLIDRGTALNDDFLDQAEAHHLPSPFGGYFQGARNHLPDETGICRCVVTDILGNKLSVYDINTGTSTRLIIIVPPDDPMATTSLSIGDIIFIAGDRHGNTIEAFGISKFPPRVTIPNY